MLGGASLYLLPNSIQAYAFYSLFSLDYIILFLYIYFTDWSSTLTLIYKNHTNFYKNSNFDSTTIYLAVSEYTLCICGLFIHLGCHFVHLLECPYPLLILLLTDQSQAVIQSEPSYYGPF